MHRSKQDLRPDFTNWAVGCHNMIARDTGDLFKNFETYSGNTSGAGFSYPVTYPLTLIVLKWNKL